MLEEKGVNIEDFVTFVMTTNDKDTITMQNFNALKSYYQVHHHSPRLETTIQLQETTTGIATELTCTCKKHGELFKTHHQRTNYIVQDKYRHLLYPTQ